MNLPPFRLWSSILLVVLAMPVNAQVDVGDTAFISIYLKAMSEVQLGKTTDAIHTLEGGLHLHPENPTLHRMLAAQYDDAGNYVKARESYLDMLRTDSTDLAAMLKLAEIAAFRQQNPLAVEYLEKVFLLDSMNLTSLMMMGDILTRLNNSGAVVYYQRAYEFYPKNQKAAYALGNRLIHNKKALKAIPICEHMLELDSTNIKFHKLLGYAHYKVGNPGASITQFRKAVDLGDSTAFTFKFMGISQYLSVDFQEAIASLRKGVEKDSLDAEIHFFLGSCLASTTHKKEAMTHLDKSLELMKPDPSVISRIYSEQGNIKRLEMQYEPAYSLYQKAWEADSSNLMALYYMASIKDNSMHLSAEALVDYQKFIDHLDLLPESKESNQQFPSIRSIVEDRIISLKEELFFLDQQ